MQNCERVTQADKDELLAQIKSTSKTGGGSVRSAKSSARGESKKEGK